MIAQRSDFQREIAGFLEFLETSVCHNLLLIYIMLQLMFYSIEVKNHLLVKHSKTLGDIIQC